MQWHTTINPLRRKKGVMLLSRLARGGVGWSPRSTIRMHHAYSVFALLYLVDKGLHTKRIYTSHLSHIISVLVIPNEFPTLLAKREIIANAFCLLKCLKKAIA